MEDLIKISATIEECDRELQQMQEDFIGRLRITLYGAPATVCPATNATGAGALVAASPQQTKKRAKRLTSLNEVAEENALLDSEKKAGERTTRAASNAETVQMRKDTAEIEGTLMPPPLSVCNESMASGRPQRAAKLNCEKNLKEPTLKGKLRREVKLEHEQRASQYIVANEESKASSIESEQSIIVVPNAPVTIDIPSGDDEEGLTNATESKKTSLEKAGNKATGRDFRVMIKREQPSIGNSNLDEPDATRSDCATVVGSEAVSNAKDIKFKPIAHYNESNSTSNDCGSVASKRKNKKNHQPIKVERFSDIGAKPSPVASRTRRGSATNGQPNAENRQGASFYEDAVDNPDLLSGPPNGLASAAEAETSKAIKVPGITDEKVSKPDATMILGAASSDETFRVNSDGVQQTTFVIANKNTVGSNKPVNGVPNACNETYNVCPEEENKRSLSSTQQSMETAKDTSNPEHSAMITEDESFTHHSPPKNVVKPHAASKLPTPSKNYKMPTRPNELFNPLIQSPVKMKVKAFENAVSSTNTLQTKSTYSTRAKENFTSSTTTPLASKYGRFLTPTQTANVTTSNVKKAPNSTSKLIPFPKATTASGKMSRENSAEEMRKGLQLLAEERKKQREQKHQLAAQQREAKERERAERLAKLAKEREEKRLKKQLEVEQKKKHLEEAERKLRQNEEMATAESTKQKAAKKAIMDQEREMLAQVKQMSAQKLMLPPPPRVLSKYTFEMLHEGDSTDEEDKVSHKRPPPPKWSLKAFRVTPIQAQQKLPTDVIDSFFSVEPMTPDLKLIFPDIDARHLKRNSSVLWSSPVRYSELPKY